MMTACLYNLYTVSESHIFTTMNLLVMPYSVNNCRESITVIFCVSFVELFVIAGWARSNCQCEVHSSRSISQNSHCILYGKSLALCIASHAACSILCLFANYKTRIMFFISALI